MGEKKHKEKWKYSQCRSEKKGKVKTTKKQDVKHKCGQANPLCSIKKMAYDDNSALPTLWLQFGERHFLL